jgi:oligopeptidase A
MSNSSLNANPLLASHTLPPFSSILPEHVEPAIQQLINESRAQLAEILSQSTAPTWNSLVAPLEAQSDKLDQAWSPVSHLNAVANSDALRDAYTRSVALLTEYGTEVSQNQALYDAYAALRASEEYVTLSTAQQKAIDNALRDFRLGGVALPPADKKRFGDIQQRLSELSTQFSNNVLDATQAWFKHFESVDALAGLPESALAQAAQTAQQKGLSGYVITLDFPSYYAVIMYADDRALREDIYRAYVTRASSLGKKADGSSAAEWDNAALIDETLALRHELAQLLGFKNYAERSLASKMAQSVDEVLNFLTTLAGQSKPYAEKDIKELKDYAHQQGINDVQAWDITYYSEKLRVEKYAVSQEELRAYFPAENVIQGMFSIVEKLFGIHVQSSAVFDSYHPDVRFYRITKNGQHASSYRTRHSITRSISHVQFHAASRINTLAVNP